MIEKLHIDWKKAYPILLQRCKKKKIKFLTSTFSKKDYEKVKPYNLDYIKIPSGEIVNTPLLEAVSKSKKTILLSTGMSTVKDISKALNILNKKCNVKKRVILLHCVSNYPTQFKNVNLMSIPFLKKKFFLNVGLSDHSLGIEVSIAAVALGARVIEKHFTLNKKSFGPDHSSSLEPHELKNMIASIRNIELAIGKEEKIPNREEIETKKLVRQSVHAIKNIEKGEEFTKLNISLMRPNNGLNPDQLQKLIGKKSKKKFYSNDPIK
jgi:N,N'-diacetyllegionaminate synthase